MLSPDDCASVVSRIDLLRSDWLNLSTYSVEDGKVGYPPLWNLGASSYRDGWRGEKFYHKIKNRENKILIENFSDLYDIFVKKLSENIGPSEIETTLAYPGFHIFGEKNHVDKIVNIKISKEFVEFIHKDKLYDLHYNHLSRIYKNVYRSQIISVTLSIKLPTIGSGLCVWEPELKQYSTTEGFAQEIIKLGLYEDFHLGMPEIIPYIEGSAFCFSGESFHQIAPTPTIYPGDRRITLQAHGIMCDGKWRLFF
jgi:hypothetical protein